MWPFVPWALECVCVCEYICVDWYVLGDEFRVCLEEGRRAFSLVQSLNSFKGVELFLKFVQPLVLFLLYIFKVSYIILSRGVFIFFFFHDRIYSVGQSLFFSILPIFGLMTEDDQLSQSESTHSIDLMEHQQSRSTFDIMFSQAQNSSNESQIRSRKRSNPSVSYSDIYSDSDNEYIPPTKHQPKNGTLNILKLKVNLLWL